MAAFTVCSVCLPTPLCVASVVTFNFGLSLIILCHAKTSK